MPVTSNTLERTHEETQKDIHESLISQEPLLNRLTLEDDSILDVINDQIRILKHDPTLDAINDQLRTHKHVDQEEELDLRRHRTRNDHDDEL